MFLKLMKNADAFPEVKEAGVSEGGGQRKIKRIGHKNAIKIKSPDQENARIDPSLRIISWYKTNNGSRPCGQSIPLQSCITRI